MARLRGPQRWLVLAVALGAGTWAVVGSLWLFPLLSVNSDEGTYLAQADALRAGELLPEAPTREADAFTPWLAVVRDGHYVFKYTPVHAAMVASGGVLGSNRAALAFMAILDVVLLALLARELGASKWAAVIACAVFVLSPLWLIQSTTFLPYASNLVLLQGFVLLVLRGDRRSSPLELALAGVVIGIAFMSRPFDAVLVAVPTLGWIAHRRWREGADARRRLVRGAGWLAAGAVPALLVFAGYNALATGSPLRLPFHLLGSSDQLGFGDRQVLATNQPFDFTPGKSLESTVRNMGLLITWCFGSFALLALAAFGLSKKPRLPSRSLVALLLAAWPIGYFFYWGSYATVYLWDGALVLGPYYYLPMLVPLSIAAGVGAHELVLRWPRAVAVGAAAMVAITVVAFVPIVQDNEARTRAREQVMRAVQPVRNERESLLLVPDLYGAFVQHPFSFLRNRPGLTGRVVYALDGTRRSFAVTSMFPRRRAFTLSVPSGFVDQEPERPVVAFVEPITRVSGRALRLAVHTSRGLGRGAVLRVKHGRLAATVPMVDDARGGSDAALLVQHDGNVVVVRAPDGTILATGPLDENLPLELALVAAGPGATGDVVFAREVPMRRQGARTEVLWPGRVVVDDLGRGNRTTWRATAESSGAIS